MNHLDWLQVGLKAIWAVFIFAFGACAGSLTNVLVYRLPRGLDAVYTPSRCPCCETKLTWRENIPVFGWLLLGGRCRFCKSKISAEYPLVEALVGLLWVWMYLVYYALPQHAYFLGVDLGSLRPEWAVNDASGDGWPRTTWPIFIVHLFIVGSLVAMTLVDAKTFTIPLVLPWVATAVGIAFHTIGAAMLGPVGWNYHQPPPNGIVWAIPTPGWCLTTTCNPWWWIGASFGAVLGLVIANLLLHFQLIRRSFADYADWEKQALKAQGFDPDAQPMHHDHTPGAPTQPDPDAPVGEHVGPGVRLVLRFVSIWLICALGLGLLSDLYAKSLGYPAWSGLALGTLLGPFIGALACRSLAPSESVASPSPSHPITPSPSAPDLWIAYPHARREMLKELIFLTPALALGWLGGTLASRFGSGLPPLWLTVLCGTLMGSLIGGGVVWAIRIGGSIAFGKEAMGLGDVHLMAAVGACLGWLTAALAVPLAAMVGLYSVLASLLARRPAGRTMPFGPYLAVATLLILFSKPLVEHGLTFIAAIPPGTPTVHLP